MAGVWMFATALAGMVTAAQAVTFTSTADDCGLTVGVNSSGDPRALSASGSQVYNPYHAGYDFCGSVDFGAVELGESVTQNIDISFTPDEGEIIWRVLDAGGNLTAAMFSGEWLDTTRDDAPYTSTCTFAATFTPKQ